MNFNALIVCPFGTHNQGINCEIAHLGVGRGVGREDVAQVVGVASPKAILDIPMPSYTD